MGGELFRATGAQRWAWMRQPRAAIAVALSMTAFVAATGVAAAKPPHLVFAAVQSGIQSTSNPASPSGQLLDQLTIDEDSLSFKVGTHTLTAGVGYTLVVSGIGTYSNAETMDALYCVAAMNSGACAGTPPVREVYMVNVGIAGAPFSLPMDAFQHATPDPDPNCNSLSCPDGLRYQKTHVYTTTFYPPATGVLEVKGDAAAIGYHHSPPDTGKFTFKVYGSPHEPHITSITPDSAGPHGGTPVKIKQV
jgi:hypothetical protein